MSRSKGGGRSAPRPSVFWRVLPALPELALAVACLVTVLDPAARDGATGLTLWRAALLEFFALHASGFLNVTWLMPEWKIGRRAAYVALLAGAYTVALALLALATGAWWVVPTFWVLTGRRTFEALVRQSPASDDLQAEAEAWAGTLVVFVVCAVAVGVIGTDRVTVLWGAAVYFAALAVSTLGDWWWARAWLTRVRGSGPHRRG